MTDVPRTSRPTTEQLLGQHQYASSMDVYRSPQRERQARSTVANSPAPRSSRHRWRWLLGVLLLLAIGCWWHFDHGATKTRHQVQNVVDHIDGKAQKAKQAAAALTAAKATEATASATFAGQVNAIIAANPSITWSVSTVTQYSGLQHYGNSDTFLAASTGKLFTATYLLNQVEQGKVSLSQSLDGDTVGHLLDIMIVNSDDNAWEDLNNYLTYPSLQSYANGLGITDYQSYPNTLSSNDIAVLLNKLYQGELLNKTDTNLLLGYMKIANYREYVVPAVPSDDTVYHKIGLYADDVHDATIITHGNKALVLVIFTNGNGTQNWPARALIMQQIAKDAIADYLPGT